MEQVVIIGSGSAGFTAAIYAARANLKPLLFSGIQPGGLLTTTTLVENFPGFENGIDGWPLMEEMQKQCERFGTRIEYDTVVEANLVPGGPHTLKTANGMTVETRTVIIATGASHRHLGIESEKQLENKGVTYCATCDGAFFKDMLHVVVGGGDSAMEEAIFLTRFASKVTVVHRRDELRASKIMADRALAHDKIEFAWNSAVDEILGVDEDKVTGVRLKDTVDGSTREIPAGAVFVAIGHVPNTQPFKDLIELDEGGYVVLQNNSSYTSMDAVFAAGDCADRVYRQAITAAGMGCKAAIDAERWLESHAD